MNEADTAHKKITLILSIVQQLTERQQIILLPAPFLNENNLGLSPRVIMACCFHI